MLEIFDDIKDSKWAEFHAPARSRAERFLWFLVTFLGGFLFPGTGFRVLAENELLGILLILSGAVSAGFAMFLFTSMLDNSNVVLSWISPLLVQIIYLVALTVIGLLVGIAFLGAVVGNYGPLDIITFLIPFFFLVILYFRLLSSRLRLSIYTNPLILWNRNLSRGIIPLAGKLQTVGHISLLLIILFSLGFFIFLLVTFMFEDVESLQDISTMAGGAFLGFILALFHGRISAGGKVEKALHEGRNYLRGIEHAVSRYHGQWKGRSLSATVDIIEAIDRYLAWGAEFKYGKYRNLVVGPDWHSNELWKLLREQIDGREYVGQFRETHELEIKKIISFTPSPQSAVRASANFARGLRKRLESSWGMV